MAERPRPVSNRIRSGVVAAACITSTFYLASELGVHVAQNDIQYDPRYKTGIADEAVATLLTQTGQGFAVLCNPERISPSDQSRAFRMWVRVLDDAYGTMDKDTELNDPLWDIQKRARDVDSLHPCTNRNQVESLAEMTVQFGSATENMAKSHIQSVHDKQATLDRSHTLNQKMQILTAGSFVLLCIEECYHYLGRFRQRLVRGV